MAFIDYWVLDGLREMAFIDYWVLDGLREMAFIDSWILDGLREMAFIDYWTVQTCPCRGCSQSSGPLGVCNFIEYLSDLDTVVNYHHKAFVTGAFLALITVLDGLREMAFIDTANIGSLLRRDKQGLVIRLATQNRNLQDIITILLREMAFIDYWTNQTCPCTGCGQSSGFTNPAFHRSSQAAYLMLAHVLPKTTSHL